MKKYKAIGWMVVLLPSLCPTWGGVWGTRKAAIEQYDIESYKELHKRKKVDCVRVYVEVK